MNPTEHTLWVSVIIVGFIVVVAVAALLSLLIYLIKRIDHRGLQHHLSLGRVLGKVKS